MSTVSFAERLECNAPRSNVSETVYNYHYVLEKC